MPEAFTTTKLAIANGRQYRQVFNASGTNIERVSPSISAAKVGQLTTRTSATVGTLTMTGGHGITTASTIVIFWAGGSRRAVVGTVSTNSVPFSTGAGDDLPANLTAITAMMVVPVGFIVPPDPTGIAVKSPTSGWVGFYDDTSALIAEYFIDAGKGKSWNVEYGTSSPFTSASTRIETVKFAQGDSTGSKTMYATVVFNG